MSEPIFPPTDSRPCLLQFGKDVLRESRAMDKRSKWRLIVATMMIAAAVAWQFGTGKYDSMLHAASQGISFGKAYGESNEQGDCVRGLSVRYSKCETTECELAATGYIAGCMAAARKDGFCGSVPSVKDVDEAMDWVSEACATNGLGGGRCLKYMHKVVRMCTEQVEGRKLTNAEILEGGFRKGFRQGLQ